MANLLLSSEKEFSSARYIELIRSGKNYFNLLEQLINEATASIHLQTYILDPDETGLMIIDALIRASKRNVNVYLVVDAYGSKQLSKKDVNRMIAAGIHFKWFEPIFDFKNLSVGRRLHHKITIFDSEKAIVGGINISNHYNDVGDEIAWLDFAALVEGPVCHTIEERAISILGTDTRKNIVSGEKEEIRNEPVFPVRSIVNDWLKGQNEITHYTRRTFNNATESIIIVGSYFHPGRRLRSALRAATERQVNVKIILTHFSDVPFSTNATRYFYRWMLKNNIQLYEWKKSVLHGKAAIVDNNWVTIGSFNFNILSAFESIELNLEILNPSFAMDFQKTLEIIIKNDCIRIEPAMFEKKYNFMLRIMDWISYHIVRYSMRFPLLFAKRVRDEKRKWR